MITSISLENIRKGYTPSNFSLSIDNLEFNHHGINVIVGPNGSGKSTLLRLIAFVEKPEGGRVLFDGQDVLCASNGQGEFCRKIGFVTQNPYLFNMDVGGNVSLGLKIRKYSRGEITSRVKETLRTLNISHLASRDVRELSGGERQKVALAQVLVLKPEILLLDEPTASIDAQSVSAIEETIGKIQRELQSVVIMTTHSLSQAYRISPDIISLAQGRIADFVHENIFFGELKEHSGGLKHLKVAEDLEIILTTEKSGSVHVAVDPEDIIVSGQKPQTSARNCFRGRVTKVESIGPNVRLVVDVGVEIYSIITKQSFTELGINLASEVYASFKVNSVQVI